MAQVEIQPRARPTWQSLAGWISAVLVGLLFLIAGVWKITAPFAAAERMRQALVPHALSLAAAVGFGTAEVVAGLWIMIPRFRRWGAWVSGLLLAAFLLYIGVHYNALRGEDCNCFPWVRRAVGPAFFLSDLAMLALAVVAGRWAEPARDRRRALVLAAAVALGAGISLGAAAWRQSSVSAPPSILVEGRPFSLERGRVFLYFFDPECSHCDRAARAMSRLRWRDVTRISVPTAQPQFARQFVDATGFRSLISSDAARLRQAFSFADPPYAVALEDGRVRAAMSRFDAGEPEQTLRRLGFIE